jgi:carbon monoxide dehydrogenase subunit G
MKLQRSIEIAASPEKIWPFLVEPEKIMKWFTFLKKFEYTSTQKSGAGTTFYYEAQLYSYGMGRE